MRWVRSPCRSNVDVDFVVRSVTGTIVSSRKLPLIWSACYTCEKIANLVEKSLTVAEVNNAGVHYRLFDSTRAYALEKLVQGGEHEEFLRRHAEYYCKLCERAELEWETTPTAEWLATYRTEIDNFRSALDWAFSLNGDAALGIRLTVAMVPLWMQLSLIEECCIRIERAVTVPDKTNQSTRRSPTSES